MSDLKTELAVLVGRVAHHYGNTATQVMLANLARALGLGPAPDVPDLMHRPIKPLAAIMREVVTELSEETGYSVEELRGHRRCRGLSEARFECWARIYATGLASYPQIGRYFGGRDHSTIIHGVREALRIRSGERVAG